MRQHKIKKLALGVMIAAACSACSTSMLDETLYSQPGAATLTGPEGAALLTNGIYSYVQYLSYNGGNNWLLGTETNTDEFFCNWGGIPETGWAGQQNFLNLDAGHSMVQLSWDQLYKIISQSNAVVTKFGTEQDTSIRQSVAQARFWRAYAYEKLYFVYGTVPLVTGTEDLSKGIARASKEELDAFIEGELKAVENVLPATYPSSSYGRPTRWAVKAFLARYYLNRKNWQQAAVYAKDVIDHSGLSLASSYEGIFSPDGSSEIILAVNEVAQAGKGNKYVALALESGIRDALGITGVSASNGYGMSVPFYRSFAPGDKRIAPYNPATGKGIAVAGIVYKANGDPVYGTPAAPKTVEQNLNRVLTFKFPVQNNIPLGEDADADVPLLRLGETYLTYAEAENELGNVAEAEKYVSPIRQRAGLNDITGLSQAAMRTAILDERGWELYHEGYRREDLLRAGKLLEKVNVKYQYYFNKPMPWAGDQNRLLQPIPTSALQLDPLLEQNPGYK